MLHAAVALTIWFTLVNVLVLSVMLFRVEIPDAFTVVTILATYSYVLLPVRWALVLTLLIRGPPGRSHSRGSPALVWRRSPSWSSSRWCSGSCVHRLLGALDRDGQGRRSVMGFVIASVCRRSWSSSWRGARARSARRPRRERPLPPDLGEESEVPWPNVSISSTARTHTSRIRCWTPSGRTPSASTSARTAG